MPFCIVNMFLCITVNQCVLGCGQIWTCDPDHKRGWRVGSVILVHHQAAFHLQFPATSYNPHFPMVGQAQGHRVGSSQLPWPSGTSIKGAGYGVYGTYGGI